jgi:hypothetical protein
VAVTAVVAVAKVVVAVATMVVADAAVVAVATAVITIGAENERWKRASGKDCSQLLMDISSSSSSEPCLLKNENQGL